MTTITSNAEFAKKMMLLAQPAERFRPVATYDPDGDCIEFLAKPDPFYAERVDDLVTVYYSQETGEVIVHLPGLIQDRDNVNVMVVGIAPARNSATIKLQFLDRMPGFRIEIHDGPVSLQHIFLARLWSAAGAPDDIATLTYRKLIDVAHETKIEGELCVS